MFPFTIKFITSFDYSNDFRGKPRTDIIANSYCFGGYALVIQVGDEDLKKVQIIVGIGT